MDATRPRLGSLLEWIVAAAFLFATVVVASLIVQELRAARVVPVAPAGDPLPASAEAVPTRAISVPMLQLLDGKQVRVGDTLEHIAGLLGRAAEVGKQEIGRGAIGERLTRYYDHAGTRFILVFEPFERNGSPRIAAIYIQ